MIGEVKDLVGQKFGKLTVVEQHGFTNKNKHGFRQAIWYCKCDCGNYCEIDIRRYNSAEYGNRYCRSTGGR